MAGNVRQGRVATIHRESALFRSLHDPKQLKGRCGDCEHHAMCGGSARGPLPRRETRSRPIRCVTMSPGTRTRTRGATHAALSRLLEDGGVRRRTRSERDGVVRRAALHRGLRSRSSAAEVGELEPAAVETTTTRSERLTTPAPSIFERCERHSGLRAGVEASSVGAAADSASSASLASSTSPSTRWSARTARRMDTGLLMRMAEASVVGPRSNRRCESLFECAVERVCGVSLRHTDARALRDDPER